MARKPSLLSHWLEFLSSCRASSVHLQLLQNHTASILSKTMLSSISEKVKTRNVSIMNDSSLHRKKLLIYVTNIYLFQPELLNFD